MNVTIKTLLNLVLALLLSLTFAQCSSDEEKELKEPVETDQAASTDEKDDYEEQDTDGDSSAEDAEDPEDSDDSIEPEDSASADVLGDMQSVDPSEPEDDTAVAMEPIDQAETYSPDPLTSAAPTPEPSMETTENSAAASMATQPSGWRVWYVKSNEATTYRDTSAKESSGSFSKGESLLLKVEGQWAMLQDGRYLKASALSQKPVSRIRKAGSWR